jgi:hypothetical protein
MSTNTCIFLVYHVGVINHNDLDWKDVEYEMDQVWKVKIAQEEQMASETWY